MTDHGWPEHPDDVPDLDPAGDPFAPLDEAPHHDPGADDDLPGGWELPEEPPPVDHHDPAPPQPWAGDDPPAAGGGDVAPEPGDPPGVFPPAVDVGALPEPVDGFPWIDTGSLGAELTAAELTAAAPAGAPTVQDLAAHAATDLPPGADPWDVLAGSDDPATAALARFYRPPGDT